MNTSPVRKKISLISSFFLILLFVLLPFTFTSEKAYAVETWNNCKCTNSGEQPEFVCDGQADKACESDGHVCFEKAGSTSNNGINNQGEQIEVRNIECRPPAAINETQPWSECKCLDTFRYECTVGGQKLTDSCESEEHYCVKGEGPANKSKKYNREIKLAGVYCAGINENAEWRKCHCLPGIQGEFKDRSYECEVTLDNGQKTLVKDACEKPGAKCEAEQDQNKAHPNKSGNTGKEYKNIYGVVCLQGSDIKRFEPTLPPPPSPPCAQWAPDGRCLAVQTSLDKGEAGKFLTDPAGFITRMFALLLGISGGIGTLLIIRAGYIIMTSQAKPEALQKGREELVAAIVGLVFLILSFVILQTIGVDILRIPEFK